MSTFPVVAEVWSILEATLMAQARKLTEDLAKYQKADPKQLWQKVKEQVKVGLVDIDLPDSTQVYCSHQLPATDGAIRLRCRSPCLLGYTACPAHVNTPLTQSATTYERVDRIWDFQGRTYFVDKHGIARDRNGRPKGIVKEEVLFEFRPVAIKADETG
jgi:hypothetical protein